jgi:hypothetical protein
MQAAGPVTARAVSTQQGRAAGNGASDAHLKARQRRLASHPDRYVRATARLADRGQDTCDCPCHWWPQVSEAVPCCPSRGLRWAGEGFVPFSDDQEV